MHFMAMTEQELLDEVRRMRSQSIPPKGIARALNVRPAVIAPLVRRVAAEAGEVPIESAEVVGCWISRGWSRGLIVEWCDGWTDADVGPDGPAGIALVLVARARRSDKVSVCGYLVDTFCLGVKNVIGPEPVRRRTLPSFVRTYFMSMPGPGLRAPLALAQHVVHGAAAFAAGLGFDPHPDYAAARGHLGELDRPCGISFGQDGRPLFVPGPYDDAVVVAETLMSSVGPDGFAIAAL
jgi:hypothetical protein